MVVVARFESWSRLLCFLFFLFGVLVVVRSCHVIVLGKRTYSCVEAQNDFLFLEQRNTSFSYLNNLRRRSNEFERQTKRICHSKLARFVDQVARFFSPQTNYSRFLIRALIAIIPKTTISSGNDNLYLSNSKRNNDDYKRFITSNFIMLH
jgi:hypothetical protein